MNETSNYLYAGILVVAGAIVGFIAVLDPKVILLAIILAPILLLLIDAIYKKKERR